MPTSSGKTSVLKSMALGWLDISQFKNSDEYAIYLSCADDGTGHEIMTGEPLKTYEEWLSYDWKDLHVQSMQS